MLAIRNLLQIRNGDIISAVLLWKNNIDKEIDGMEECFICYCVLHPTDKSLPRMPCKNCKNKFHVSCIRKWFKTSNKSNCPLCQAYFFWLGYSEIKLIISYRMESRHRASVMVVELFCHGIADVNSNKFCLVNLIIQSEIHQKKVIHFGKCINLTLNI